MAAEDGRVNISELRLQAALDEDELLVIEEEQEELRADRMANPSRVSENRAEMHKSEDRFGHGAYSKMSTLERDLGQMNYLEEHAASQLQSPVSGQLGSKHFHEVAHPKPKKGTLVSTE